MNPAPGVSLAIDASTYEGSVAVIRDGVLVAAGTAMMRGETEERLMPAALAVLDSASATVRDIERVVCGAGPGSFTSLRIAAAIAKGIAMGNEVPLFGVSSLALIVAAAEPPVSGRYLAVLDAMRGERYVALFTRAADGGVAQDGEVTRMPVADVGPAAERLGATVIGPLESQRQAPHAGGVVALLSSVIAAGPVALDSWEPAYGRLAEAQVKWETAHGKPLGQ